MFLVMAVFVMPVSVAWANATYGLCNYPNDQFDSASHCVDTLSGTIVTDGTLGPQTDTSHILSVTVTITTDAASYTHTLMPSTNPRDTPVGFDLTPTQILIQPGAGLWFYDDTAPSLYSFFTLYYDDAITQEGYGWFIPPTWGVLVEGPPYVQENSKNAYFENIPQGGAGSIAPTNPTEPQQWVIATTTTVPEPGTLTLLASAMLGLGAFYLRRRRATV
jgi:hypothetical protein